MSVARNCQNGVRLARPTNPLFFEGQSVEVSGGCFFGAGRLSEFLDSVFFCFFLFFSVYFLFFLFFFRFFSRKKTKNKQKINKTKKQKKKGSPKKKRGHPRTPEPRAASHPTPPHSALEKFGACWNHTLRYTSLRSLLLRLVLSICSSLFFPFVFIFILFFPFVFIFILFFPFVFIFILFFWFVSFLFFFCSFYLFWNSSKLELWFS